jgi:hypothetical protein
MSDPSGAEMRSPNDDAPFSESDRAHVLSAAMPNLSSEVSPRSSGGAPNEAARTLARLLDYAGHKSGGGWCGPVTCQCGYAEARDAAIAAVATLGTDRDDWQTLHAAWTKRANEAEAQVSALRQEAANSKIVLEESVLAFERATAAGFQLAQDVTAARQEAETLTRQRDAAIREISVIAREAEALRKQLDEARQAADGANEEEAVARRALDSQALDYEALSREAETLRGQRDEALKDTARLDWLAQSDDWKSSTGARLRVPNIRGIIDQAMQNEAIDAARVAAPREPK